MLPNRVAFLQRRAAGPNMSRVRGEKEADKRASVQSGQTFFDTIPQKCSWIIAVSCKFAIADSRAIFLETSLLGGNTHTWYPRAYAHTHIRTNPHEPRSTIWIPNIYHPDYAPVAHNTYIRSHRIAPYHIALNDHENGPIATGTWPVRQRRASSPTRRTGKSDFFSWLLWCDASFLSFPFSHITRKTRRACRMRASSTSLDLLLWKFHHCHVEYSAARY